jgi:very-short-patch-repair endonuclease
MQDEKFNIGVDLEHSPCVNFAFQQNAIPVVQRLVIRNDSDERLQGVTCTLSVSPEVAPAITREIRELGPHDDQVIMDLPLQLSFEALSSWTEKVRGQITVKVEGIPDSLEESVVLLEKHYDLSIYAWDEWTGLVTLPEILAAFVTPNADALSGLLNDASVLLEKRTGLSALDGYQSKSRERVYQLIGALYDTVKSRGIRYSNPPASFEKTGQRVRFADQIFESGFATCLDLSLLFASLMEQVGLRPLVLLHEGHAYVGCWLEEESFSEAAVDDLQTIRKRVELESLMVFESTACVDGKSANLRSAETQANEHLQKDDIFQYAIDISQSRKSGILPLPLRSDGSGIAPQLHQPVTQQPATESGDRTFVSDSASIDIKDDSPQTRLDRWKQQLLDLTLRNRLLNFRETKQTIPLVCPELGELEDAVAANRAFKIKEATSSMTGEDPRDLTLLMRQGDGHPIAKQILEEMRAKRLRSTLQEQELSRRLLDLYRKVRLELEESGANTLYLAIGFLEWKETQDSEKSHRAPILLIPVELIRKSVVEGFSVIREDSDAIVNVSLLEMLRRDFGKEIPGVNPPPEDASGVDVLLVLRRFAEAVVDLKGWEVHHDVWIGRFSFSKFLLWMDLDARLDNLTKNPVVNHLVNNPGAPFDDGVQETKVDELDRTVKPSELFTPLSADSSQLAAVVASEKGKNFVLYGPPGTGKSQTIANLITHNLAIGRRVLFVAEKRAALEVVHHRLSQLGLGDFCLELHSNKTGKADVLRQFGEAMDVADLKTPSEWAYVADNLEKTRSKLNAFVTEVHKPGPGGHSAYQCYSYIIRNHELRDKLRGKVDLTFEDMATHDRPAFDRMRDTCSQLDLRHRRVPSEAHGRLQPFATMNWSPAWEKEAVGCAQKLATATSTLSGTSAAVIDALHVDVTTPDMDTLYHFIQLCAYLLKAYTVPSGFLTAPSWSSFSEEVRSNLIPNGKAYQAAVEALSGFALDQLDQLPMKSIALRYRDLSKKKSLLSTIRIKWCLRALAKVWGGQETKWHSRQAGKVFEDYNTLCETRDDLNAQSQVAKERFGVHWNGLDTEWDQLEAVLHFGDQVHEELLPLANSDPTQLSALKDSLVPLLEQAGDFLGEGAALTETIHAMLNTWNEFAEALEQFNEKLTVDVEVAVPGDTVFNKYLYLANIVLSDREHLAGWCSWRQICSQADELGVGPIAHGLDAGILTADEVEPSFELLYRSAVITHRLNESNTLREFWGEEFDQNIEQFKQLDESYMAVSAKAARARIAANMPGARTKDAVPGSEIGIIQRERSKKRRHMPVRKLLSKIPTVFPLLKPCLLMSPLSVAQYLSADQEGFDLVVFDEASQIPVWDAVGAIARGKQVIVAGDPKQLPPTNFFSRAEVDEMASDDGMVEDLESILDECLGAGLPAHHLTWHYRSRNEQLIAFSNHQYYDGRLMTFPSAHADAQGVRWVHVEGGVYDKGGTRTNRAEADAVVSEIVERLVSEGRRHLSIGVVTFSQAQQDLVENLLDEARRENPALEPFFDASLPEPVFVKNLENVQGDERDVILFSIGYGPDAAGRLSMNFGPLNREGGERRLNVAITRAKHEVMIFSTLRPEQIDLSRTKAKGVADLKAYLEYAQKGPHALSAQVAKAEMHEYESPFEQEVGDFLESKGYTLHTQVGCSGYRIDMAVLEPENPGHYLVGIECDGATYHGAATSRDRDRLRHMVLEGLGWRLVRVWSTDWWRNRATAEDRLIRAIEGAIAAGPVSATHHTATPSVDTCPELEDDANTVTSEMPSTDTSGTYPVPKLVAHTQLDDFHELSNQAVLQKQIHRIVIAEGPIVEDLLIKRVQTEWGFPRLGARIKTTIRRASPTELLKTQQGDAPVYWPVDLDPDNYSPFRVPDSRSPETKRPIDQIPREEIVNAMRHLLKEYMSLPMEDLLRETLKLFGGKQLTKTSRILLENVFEELKGDVVCE